MGQVTIYLEDELEAKMVAAGSWDDFPPLEETRDEMATKSKPGFEPKKTYFR